MEPIIHGLSNEAYHNQPPYSDYLSSSQLKKLEVSPKAFRYALDNPEPQTDAMRLGSLFHDLMACSAEHYDNGTKAIAEWLRGIAVFEPPVNEKTGQPYGTATKAYKEAYEAFLRANEGKTIATDEELSQVQKMHQAVLLDCGATSEQVRKLLKWGKPEVSIFYETEDGIKLKVRPDLLTKSKIIDWKTTTIEDLTEESINRTILRYGYHISCAMYQWVTFKALGKWLDFYLIFIQKQEPHDCIMVNMKWYGYQYIPDVDMVVPGPGAIEFQRLLDLYKKCKQNDEWPGAESFINGDRYRIMEIEPPRYLTNKYLDE